jgi:hypothetical protein
LKLLAQELNALLKHDRRRQYRSSILKKKVVAGLFLIAVIIFSAAAITGVFTPLGTSKDVGSSRLR